MKKLLSLLVAMLMLLTALSPAALAEGGGSVPEDAPEESTPADIVDGTAPEEASGGAASDEDGSPEEAESWLDTAFEDFGKTRWYVYAIIAALVVLGIAGVARFGGGSAAAPRMSPRVLSEGAMMIALATVLSMVKVWQMPLGGSVTLLSMLPIVLMSFRHGTKWGVFTAFVHSLLQLVMGLKNIGYCATLRAQVACVLLDYVFAFTVLGLASAFSRPFKNRAAGVCLGAAAVCFLRFVCHFLSGIYLWGSYKEYYEWAASMPTWLYSLLYNGNYMLPELIITVVGTVLLVRGAKRLFDRQAA